MRITVTTIEEFFECLTAVTSIFESTIRVATIRRPIDVTNKEPTRFAISVQAFALVAALEGEGEYLLQVGIPCGTDYEDASQEKTGTAVAQQIRDAITSYAKLRDWRVLPGIIEE